MSTLKSSAEHLTLNADGSGNDIKFQSNGSEVASIDQAGTITATTFTGAGSTPSIVDNGNATAITIDSAENLGIGVTPSAFHNSYTGINIGKVGTLLASTSDTDGIYIGSNSYYSTAGNYKYIANGKALELKMDASTADFRFRSAAAGSADGAITWVNKMIIKADGKIGVGTGTSPTALVDIHAAGTPTLAVHNTAGSGNATIHIGENDMTAYGGEIRWVGSNGALYFDNRYNHGTNPRMHFRMRTNGTPITAMTIMPDGKIGILDDSPSTALEVNGVVTATSFSGASGGLHALLAFTSTGTWTKPAGVSKIKVTVTGGGGGGGAYGASNDKGAGGGGGGTAIELIDVSSLSTGATVAVTIGAAGSGASGGSQNGGGGGTTSFGSYCSASPGNGGAHGNAGPVPGGYGGIGSGGTINIEGGDGNNGQDNNFVTGYDSSYGIGGATFWGGGGRGTAHNAGAKAGQAWGSGGGGGAEGQTAGGPGNHGICMVEEYK